jgi:transcriptional regulator with XRE-family HTH domain
MESIRELAAFLRARRELLKPADVGLPDSERRRVEGLRREEVAMLAGISTEYYLKLEQGRDHQPSDQVLDGLARALQLDEDAAIICVRWRDRRHIDVDGPSLKGATRQCKL